ncbi:MAG: hypothetical protein RLN82_00090 [Pseudomonadales bacterium]
MKSCAALIALATLLANSSSAAELNEGDLEARVLSGEITPEAAILEYCQGDSTEMAQDAFCSCPEEALGILKERLKAYRLDAS